MLDHLNDLLMELLRHSQNGREQGILKSIDGLSTTRSVLSDDSILAQLRLELIHNRRLSLLRDTLEAIRQRALDLAEVDAVSLLDVLLFNVDWHEGNLSDCQRFIETHPVERHPFRDILRLFVAYYYNTIGCFEHSARELRFLRSSPVSVHADKMVGVEILPACTTWLLWSRIETLDYTDVSQDWELVSRVYVDPQAVAPKSASMLLLAYGVFALVHANLSDAETYLLRAERYAENGDGTWLPRIYSALALTMMGLCKPDESAYYLELALRSLGGHFGPSGWMLRIGECLDLHRRRPEAMRMFETVLAEARRRGEVGYQVWARINLVQRHAGNDQPLKIFELAHSHGMRRACAHMLRHGLVPA